MDGGSLLLLMLSRTQRPLPNRTCCMCNGRGFCQQPSEHIWGFHGAVVLALCRLCFGGRRLTTDDIRKLKSKDWL